MIRLVYLLKHLIVVASLLTLFACATKSSPSTLTSPGVDTEVIEREEAARLPKPAKKSFVHNAAVKRILKNADHYIFTEEYGTAVQELERGLAISPNNPVLWQKMAEVRFKQGRYHQAEQLANKSNALSQGDESIQATNSQIIADSHKARSQRR